MPPKKKSKPKKSAPRKASKKIAPKKKTPRKAAKKTAPKKAKKRHKIPCQCRPVIKNGETLWFCFKKMSNGKFEECDGPFRTEEECKEQTNEECEG